MDGSGDIKRDQKPRKTPKYARGAVDKKRWINLFDILIILLVIAGILLGIFHNQIFSFVTRSPDVKDEKIQYVLEFSHVDALLKKALAQGDVVYLSGDSLALGTIERVESVENSFEIAYDPDTGLATKQYYPDNTLVDITVVLSADVKLTAKGYYIEDVRLAIGREYEIKTTGFTGSATLTVFGN